MMRVLAVLFGVAYAVNTQNAFTTLLHAVEDNLSTANKEKTENRDSYNKYMCVSLKQFAGYSNTIKNAADNARSSRDNFLAASAGARAAKNERNTAEKAKNEATRQRTNELKRSENAKKEHDAAVKEATASINLLSDAAKALRGAGKEGFLQARPEVQNLIQLYMPQGESFLSTKIDNAVDAVAESFEGMVRQKMEEVQELNSNEMTRMSASEDIQTECAGRESDQNDIYVEQANTFADQSQTASDAQESASENQNIFNKNSALLQALQKQMDDTRAEFQEMHENRSQEIADLSAAQQTLSKAQGKFKKSAKRSASFLQVEAEKSRAVARLMSKLTTGGLNLGSIEEKINDLQSGLEGEISWLQDQKKSCLTERAHQQDVFSKQKNEEQKQQAIDDAQTAKKESHDAAVQQDAGEISTLQKRQSDRSSQNAKRTKSLNNMNAADKASLTELQKACEQISNSRSNSLLQQPNFRDRNAAAGNSLLALCNQVTNDLKANMSADAAAKQQEATDFQEYSDDNSDAQTAAGAHKADQTSKASSSGQKSSDAADADNAATAARDEADKKLRAINSHMDNCDEAARTEYSHCGCFDEFVQQHNDKVSRARDEISGINQVMGMIKRMARIDEAGL